MPFSLLPKTAAAVAAASVALSLVAISPASAGIDEQPPFNGSDATGDQADPNGVPVAGAADGPTELQSRVYVDNVFGSSDGEYNFLFGTPTSDVTSGDWDGNGKTGFAIRSGNVFTLADEKGYPTGTAGYGKAGDILVIGDWDGNRSDTFGVRRGNHYFLRNSATTGPAEIEFAYGRADDEVFIGDWNGNGVDTFAVRRGNVFLVRNSTTTGVADTTFGYGKAGDEVFVGDWDGNGTDSFAVRRGNTIYIRNDFRTGVAQYTFSFGQPPDQILVGDWDADGTDTLAARRVAELPVPNERTVTTQDYTSYASTGGVTLSHPGDQIEFIGFHESGHDGSQQATVAASAAAWTTLPTRFRGTGSRTAADIVVPPATTIKAPVTGTVLYSGTYALYCKYRDDYLYIAPDAQPTWEVRIFHIDGVQVAAGDRVTAGVTTIAPRATHLPFESQVDVYTGEPSWPHVHVEVVNPAIPDRTGGGC